MKNPFFRFSCAVLLCCCLTGCGSIQHKSSTDTAQAQGTKAPPKTADDFSISSDSENETIDETSSADAATPSASESVTQQELLTGATALYSNGQEISFDPSWQYADFSAINSGTATIYLADSDRKDIVVGVNAGHGTSGGASVKTQCHPDGSPKTTGGSTAQGATYATAVSGGMTFNDGTAESTVTLQMAQILKDKLLAQGYDVLMVRNSDDVQLDNVARTVVCNNVADCHISLHWDGDGLGYDKGCFYISVPDGLKSMEPVASHWQEHDALGASLVEGLRTEGMTIYQNGSMNIDLTQTSYSTIPSVDMELGNASSDHSDSTLNSLADGLVLGLNIWTTNDNALYSAGLGLANIFRQKKKPMVLISGIIGTLLSVWLYYNFCNWLNVLNCTLPPVGIILVLSYFINMKEYDSDKVEIKTVNWFAVIGVIAGAVVANLVSWGIASINGMAVAAVCYVAGQVVCKNREEAAENA